MRSMVVKWIVAASLAASVSLAGCGGDGDSSDSSGSGGDGGGGDRATLTIEGFAFDPSEVKVAPGETVTVRNDDGVTHTVTADDGAFDVEVGGGSDESFDAPQDAGTYAFHCEIHSSMRGELVVE